MKGKWKKILTVFLLSLTVLMTGCGANEEAEAVGTGENGQGEVYQLTMMFPIFGSTPADMQKVQDEINKICMAEINTEVTLLPISFGSYMDQANLMLSGGEKVDMLVVFSQQLSNFAAKNQLFSMDEVMADYGSGIVEVIGEDYLRAGQVNGNQYAVTTARDLAQNVVYVMRKDIVNKYDIDVSAIKSLEDVEAVLELVKENEPDVVPIVPGQDGASIVGPYVEYDGLNDGYGVLMENGKSHEVVNYCASQEYKDILDRMRKWYLAGYILEDATTAQETGSALLKSGRAFSYLYVGKPGYLEDEERNTGVELEMAELLPAKTNTSVVQTTQWAIPFSCENPEKTMQFMNLMYTNADIMNLLSWGIEGEHYQVLDDGCIDYPEGVDSSNTGYGLNMGWMFGNQFISYVWEGTDPELWAKMKEFNENAVKSDALGFTYDQSNVKNEVTACTNVEQQYRIALECGVVDPDEVLPQFLQGLQDAGIDKIIQEKQTQLDEWMNNN